VAICCALEHVLNTLRSKYAILIDGIEDGALTHRTTERGLAFGRRAKHQCAQDQDENDAAQRPPETRKLSHTNTLLSVHGPYGKIWICFFLDRD
jgi:hypothetical protein